MQNVPAKLQNLGSRLRDERIRRNETQALFSARIGVSVPTLRKMECGDPTVLIGYWATALEILDRAVDIDAILEPPEDLFAKYAQLKTPKRQRVSRRTRTLPRTSLETLSFTEQTQPFPPTDALVTDYK